MGGINAGTLPAGMQTWEGYGPSFHVAESLKLVLTVSPVGFHLDEEFEVDALVEELLYVLAGFGADFLKHGAPFPMRIPFCESRST